eukprot:Clim_evm83s201 gene=Clim_evmTU83s201
MVYEYRSAIRTGTVFVLLFGSDYIIPEELFTVYKAQFDQAYLWGISLTLAVVTTTVMLTYASKNNTMIMAPDNPNAEDEDHDEEVKLVRQSASDYDKSLVPNFVRLYVIGGMITFGLFTMDRAVFSALIQCTVVPTTLLMEPLVLNHLLGVGIERPYKKQIGLLSLIGRAFHYMYKDLKESIADIREQLGKMGNQPKKGKTKEEKAAAHKADKKARSKKA